MFCVTVGYAEAERAQRFCFPQSGPDLHPALAAAVPAEPAENSRAGEPPTETQPHLLDLIGIVTGALERSLRVVFSGFESARGPADRAVRTDGGQRQRQRHRHRRLVSGQRTFKLSE